MPPSPASTQSSPDASQHSDYDDAVLPDEEFDLRVKNAMLGLAELWQNDVKELLLKITEFDPRLENIRTLDAAKNFIIRHSDLGVALGKVRESGNLRCAEVRTILLDINPRMSLQRLDATNASKSATALAWEYPFQGLAHEALWRHITKHAETHARYYAPFCSIVQSSGTGKSRCIDKLSEERLLVPINLRRPDAGGFPATDKQLYDFFTEETTTATDSTIRVNAFLCSLFEQLKSVIEDGYIAGRGASTGSLAAWLHDLMTEGQSFSLQGPRRVDFYDRVVTRAEFLANAWITSSNPPMPSPKPSHPPRSPPSIKPGQSLRTAETYASKSAQEAVSSLKATCKKAQAMNSSSSWSEHPFIVLAIDEADTLTACTPDDDDITGTSSLFTHLRRALREIGPVMFSLFLSTTGKMTQFHPPRELDPSNRVSSGVYDLVPPFTVLGWDQLAQPVIGLSEGVVNFEDIGFGYQVYLGRPMFGTRHHAAIENGNLHEASKNVMVQFAAEKLLCAQYTLRALTSDQEVACLAQRVPIEFMSTP